MKWAIAYEAKAPFQSLMGPWYDKHSLRSFGLSRKDCVTIQKNVCVGG